MHDSCPEWDARVDGAVQGHVFQTSAWACVKGAMGWRPHRLTVERDGVFRAGLQILEREIPRINYRFFYAPRGPVLGSGWTEADVDLLFEQASHRARSRRAVFLKIDPAVPLTDSGGLPALLLRRGFRRAPESGGFSGVQPRCVFRLDISRTEEDLLRGMDQKTRYNIRLAERKGVTVRIAAGAEDVDLFYRLLVETARRDRFLIRPASYFHDMHRCFGSKASFFLAEREGRTIAGALALTAGRTAWYAYGASANVDRACMPNHLVQWTVIRWAKARGITLYDFRAVPSNPRPEDPLYGLYRFKKGFGAVFTEFAGEFDRVYVPWLYGVWVRGWPLFKKIRRAVLLKPSSRPEAD